MAATPRSDVVVIGAGFAGLYAIHKLTGLGFTVVAFEKGDDVGGVWYWNRYPGARCDCESYYYSYSFSKELENEWSWSLRYSEQPEILRYLSNVADRFALRRHIRFSTTVVSAEFDESSKLWKVRASSGEVVAARFVISAVGCLSAIQRPDIRGLDQFEGDLLYTAAWPREGVDFTGKRVGVIGTGASGVQVISRIAPQAAHLTVFQRTANWVIPVWNAPTSAERDAWVKGHYDEIRAKCLTSPGGMPFDSSTESAERMSPAERRAALEKYWDMGGPRFFGVFSDLLASSQANEIAADFVRAYIRGVVKNPGVAERLTPTDHPLGTKRPPMDDHYYATFNRDNVTLLDIRKAPIIGIDRRTLSTTEASCNLDVLVLATGFDAITGAHLAIDVTGRGGRKLREEWAKGARSLLGMAVAGYPNFFLVTGPLSPSVTANMPTHIEQNLDWIADCMGHMRKHGYACTEPTESAQDEWVAHVAAAVAPTLYARSNSWYFGSNIPGKPRQFGVYVGGFGTYKQRCDAIAQEGYRGFKFEI